MAISSCLSCGYSDVSGKDFDDHECAAFLALPEVDRRANRDASLRKLGMPQAGQARPRGTRPRRWAKVAASADMWAACEPCAVCGFACSKTDDGLCWACAQDVGGEGG